MYTLLEVLVVNLVIGVKNDTNQIFLNPSVVRKHRLCTRC